MPNPEDRSEDECRAPREHIGKPRPSERVRRNQSSRDHRRGYQYDRHMLTDANRKQRDAQVAERGNEREQESEPTECAGTDVPPGYAMRPGKAQMNDG